MPPITEALAVALAKFDMPYPASDIVRIEICPVKDNKDPDGSTWCEVCEPKYCKFYGVYARYKNGEAHIIKDLNTSESIAALFALINVMGV